MYTFIQAHAHFQPPGGQLCLYDATAVGITSVLSEDAPHLALHGVFPFGEAEVLDVNSWKALKSWDKMDMEKCFHFHFDQLISSKFQDTLQITQLRARFEEESQLRLPGFLQGEGFKNLMLALQASDASKSLGGGWKLHGPVLLRRLWTFNGINKKTKKSHLQKTCRAGQELAKVATVLASEEFRKYLEKLTGLELTKTQENLWIRCFRPGVDYERPSCTSNAQLDVLLTFDTLGQPKGHRRRYGGADVYSDKDAGERSAEAAGVLNGPEAIPNAPEDWDFRG